VCVCQILHSTPPPRAVKAHCSDTQQLYRAQPQQEIQDSQVAAACIGRRVRPIVNQEPHTLFHFID
jgi:hypothetical protein